MLFALIKRNGAEHLMKARSDDYAFPWYGARRALVALEDAHAQGYLQEALRRVGYKITLCLNRPLLLEKGSMDSHSLLILVNGAPEMEILRTLRKRGDLIPALLLSRGTADELPPIDPGMGRVGRLFTPFTPETLRTVIAQVCHGESEDSSAPLLGTPLRPPSGDTTLLSSKSPKA